ncbi:MAG: ABC transporter ATP-binding protein, partial [Ruminococcus sp.]|nr:ABC transporter ATP-binding protein [Ruminococcus sp.]MBQ5764356.1 ABC transporter ATP-binding protein [Ruminococcus sp.]
MSLVEFRDVYKRYQMGEITINAVDGISFSVEEGEFAVVVGASGAGKTTVLNILGGMDSCTEGEIIVGGRNVSRLSDRQLIEYRRYDIGFVFQFYNLVHNLTAKENVELAAQICR